jgi:1-acyl-sn-glycerol-3-phosphate acyltransferase
MKPKRPIFFLLYLWIIAYPIIAVATILVAVATIILSPLLPNSRLSYYPARWWGRVICKLCFVRVKVYGLGVLNPCQSYVFVLNHQSIFDVFVVYGWLPYIFKWMMRSELRKIPFVGKACEAAGHIFVNRANPSAAKASILKAESQLRNGISVVIFPEGTRTYTGAMGKFKRGAFQIAADLSLPIVPVTLKGSFERMQRNSPHITPGVIEMRIHKPMDMNFFRPEQTEELIQRTWDKINSSL